MRALAAGLISLAALLTAGSARALDLSQQPLSARRLRPADAVHAIHQGPDRMLWLGSRTGLTRYDGERFVDVDLGTQAAPARTWVRRVYAARDGSVWVATGAGALELADGSPPRLEASHGGSPGLAQLWPYRAPHASGRLRWLSRSDGLPDAWVWALAEDPRSGTWVGTEKGLALFVNGSFQRRYDQRDGLPASFVTALTLAPDGNLYVGTSAGVVVRRDGRFQPTAIREPVLAVAVDGAGRLWAAAQGRLLRVDADGRRASFPLGTALTIAVDRQDNVWAGGIGIANPLRRGASFAVYSKGEPVSVRAAVPPYLSITDITVDQEGSVWMAVREGGVFQLQTPAVRNIGLEEGLSGRIAYSLLHAQDGSTHVATNGGISRLQGDSWTTRPDGHDIGGGPRDIAEGAPGASNAGVWFSAGGHLLRADARGLGKIDVAIPGFADGPAISSIITARNGDVWLSRAPEGLFRLPRGDPKRPKLEFTTEDGLCSGYLTHPLEASDGALWFVGDYGAQGSRATRIKDGRPHCFGPADGLPDAQIGAVAEDREQVIWLGTGWGRGLVRYRQGRFATVPASWGLPESSITGLLDDGRGHLWLCSETGVWRVPKADLHRCADGPCSGLRSTMFAKDQGMRTPECVGAFHPNMALDGQGNVWVATLGGVTMFAPPEHAQRPVLMPVVEQVAIDGLAVDVTPTVTLEPRQRDLVVRYTVPSFLGAGRPRLAHRLRGFDADWIVAVTPAVAHYHDLAEGRYLLELRAGEGPAVVSSLTIVASPPLWRTPLFWGPLALVVAVLVLGLHLRRISRLKLRHRAANQERARIARDLHDGLAQKLRALGLLSDGLRQGEQERDKRVQLLQMRQIVGEADAELRRAIWDMREATSQPRLETLIEKVLSELDVPPETNLRLQTAATSLPVEGLVANETQLVVKEALTNALRHARAANIEIGVLSDEEGVHVWVRDDGRGGLPTEAQAVDRGHFGLIGMFERARRAGGVLSTRSEAGRGTEISLFVPRSSAVTEPS